MEFYIILVVLVLLGIASKVSHYLMDKFIKRY